MIVTAVRKYASDLSKRTHSLTGENYDLYHALKRCAISIEMSCGEIQKGIWTAEVMNESLAQARENRLLVSMLPLAAVEERKARLTHFQLMMLAFDAKKNRKFDAHKRRGKE